MSDTEPEVPIICPECETNSRIALSDLAASLEQHNERMHDGEEVAQVDPDIAEQLADIVAKDMGLLE